MYLNLRDRTFSQNSLFSPIANILCFLLGIGSGIQLGFLCLLRGRETLSGSSAESWTSGFLAYIPPVTAADGFCQLSVKYVGQVDFVPFLHWQMDFTCDNISNL